MSAFILLSGLFVYDIFWVFGTNVMKTVALSLNIPIKLLFFNYSPKPSMLGLGDIIIPGAFITLMHRYDRYLKNEKSSFNFHSPIDTTNYKAVFDKYFNILMDWSYANDTIRYKYFNISLVGYIFGLLSSFIFMQLTKAAQPALLYLVPSLIAAVLGAAYYESPREFEKLIAYKEIQQNKGTSDDVTSHTEPTSETVEQLEPEPELELEPEPEPEPLTAENDHNSDDEPTDQVDIDDAMANMVHKGEEVREPNEEIPTM
uniref:Minor histocompatibility antigen H13 n=1 Tax=Lygus hesperus TaxID=30085 RepID=A0A0A9WCG0_LYGHE